jgi:tripartite-type tricarboxylate transporter receptor subunit TctC
MPSHRALAEASQANLMHVPYKGAVPAITDVMGGQVEGFSETSRVDRPCESG